MERRRIGGLEVSAVGIGCNNFGWRIGADETAAVVDAAIGAGIDFFDTADVYGAGKSEEFLGRALGSRRAEVIIATKFGHPGNEQLRGARPETVRRAAEDSLRRLGTDYIDLYQLHRPDPDVPVAETLGALDELVRAGKVREIGSSNFSAEQIREAHQAARGARFASVQNDYSLLQREPEAAVLPECERLGLAFLPFFPLASGLLTGKYRKGQPAPADARLADPRWEERMRADERLDQVEALMAFAQSRGHTVLELAFAWLLARPAVASVIAGATRPAQVHANASATGWSLTADDRAEIDRVLAG
ncbi:MAG TPA: aldo/keto reductase [Longimicrobium sp.]|nr:aldo/keto reductase [Longimicrobium sp.]